MFQIKGFTAIVASIVNRMRASTSLITDYNVGSVARTLIEGPAQELDELYQQMVRGLVEAIPASTYASFNFGLLSADAASGDLLLTITAQPAAVVIGAGTTGTPISGNSIPYTVQADVVIPAGDTTAIIPIVATKAGSAGNIAAGTSFTLSPSPAGFLLCTNTNAIQNGRDLETEAQRKTRFRQYVSTLSRATPSALEYGLSTVRLTDANGNIVERVALSQIVEPYKTDATQSVGLVNCYVHNGVGSTSPALVAQAQNVMDGYYTASGTRVAGYKAAGVKCIVGAASELPVDVMAVITVLPGFDGPTIVQAAEDSVASYLLGLDVAQAGRFSKIETLCANAAAGVDFVTVITPEDDIIPPAGTKLMPGSFNISWASSLAAQFSLTATATSSFLASLT